MNSISSFSSFGPAAWARGVFLTSVVLMLVVPPPPAHAQAAGSHVQDTEIVETVPGRVPLTETGRRSWGLSETDWETYVDLMSGPAGLWYPHLAPAFVLGLFSTSDADRDRYARIVYDQERQRLDDLFAFNRAYARIAREDRARPGFSFFVEPGPVTGPSVLESIPARILAFVGPDCPRCDHAVRNLASSGQAFDIYYIGAKNNREISLWARDAGLPVSRVRDRSITLNHDAGALARAGLDAAALPVLFRDPSLRSPMTLDAVLAGAGQ